MKKHLAVCQCGARFFTFFGKFCDDCRPEAFAHGGRQNAGKRKDAGSCGRHPAGSVPIVAICPTCRERHTTWMRRQPTHTVWEYCHIHKHRRTWSQEPVTVGFQAMTYPTMDRQEGRG